MPRKTKKFLSKKLMNNFVKKLKNKERVLLTIRSVRPPAKMKTRYSVTWWEKPKKKKSKTKVPHGYAHSLYLQKRK